MEEVAFLDDSEVIYLTLSYGFEQAYIVEGGSVKSEQECFRNSEVKKAQNHLRNCSTQDVEKQGLVVERHVSNN